MKTKAILCKLLGKRFITQHGEFRVDDVEHREDGYIVSGYAKNKWEICLQLQAIEELIRNGTVEVSVPCDPLAKRIYIIGE